MKLSELMQNYPAPNPAFKGIVANDDNVLAVDISATKDAEIGNYIVVEKGIIGVDSTMNPITQDSQYIRTGQVTNKTGQQRQYAVTGDRYEGDEFQDYALSPEVKYGVGEAVKVPYVFFNMKNGKGETGEVAIIVNSDGSGNAGEMASIDINLNATAAPQYYVYVPPGTLGQLQVTSVAGSNAGETIVTSKPLPPPGMIALYKTGATATVPAYDDALNDGTWDPFSSGSSYAATTGDDFVIAYVTSIGQKARYAGKATVTAL